MTGAQLFSIVAFIVGIVLIFWARSRPPVEAVAETVAAEPAKQASPSGKRRRRR